MVWGIGTVALLVALLRQVLLARRIVRMSSSNMHLTAMAVDIARQLQNRRSPPVVVVDANVSPALFGWGAPIVILPRRSIEVLDESEPSRVMAHEIAHYVRRDHLVVAMTALIRAVVWWNPIAWWAYREIRMAQEICCDSAVLAGTTATPLSYATALLKIVNLYDHESFTRLVPAVEIGSRCSFSVRTLKRRIEMLGDQQLSPRLSRIGIGIITGFIAVALCYLTTGRSQRKLERSKRPSKGSSQTAQPAKTELRLNLPTIAESFNEHVNISGALVTGVGIVRRIEGKEFHFRTGDYIKIDESTRVLAKIGRTLQNVTRDAIRPGMAISYSINLNSGSSSAKKIFISGILKQVPRPVDAWEQIKKKRLEKLGGLRDSIDGRFPIRIQGKSGEVSIKIGETKLIALPKPTLSVQWQQGNYRPEGIEDFEKFDYLLIEWLDNSRFHVTCYRTPQK